MSSDRRVGIVGGGLTGLALTHALASRGIPSILFEAGEVPGGVVRTRRVGGRVLELGPQRTRLVGPVRRLIADLGLEGRVIEAAPGSRLFVWTRGSLRAVPTSPLALLGSDLLSRRGRIRALAEPLSGGLRPGETVAAFLRRKVGDEAYRVLLGPLVSATFGSDPEVMPAARSLPLILEPLGVRRSLIAAWRRRRSDAAAAACTFREGMGELPAALAERHAGRVRLGTRVTGIERAGRGFEILCEGGDRGRERVDVVVLTPPAPAAARLLASVAPAAAERLARLRYNTIAVVHLDVGSAPRGFGFQVAFGEPWRTRGVTWNATLFGREGVCTAYLGGGRDPEAAGASDEWIAEVAAEEYRAIHGAWARPIAVARSRLPAYDGSWRWLDDLVLPAGVRIAASYAARLGIPARIAEAERLAAELAGEIPSPAAGIDA